VSSGEVLKVLEKSVRRRRGGDKVKRSSPKSCQAASEESSSSGINNDWKNWVAVHGNDQMVVDDARRRFQDSSRTRVLGRRRGANFVGLGGLEKRKEVRKLVGDLHPFILCLPETKLHTWDVFLCSPLWGNSPHAFSYRPSVGASGGLLTLWDSSEVKVWSTESREHVLWCHGRLITSGEELFVANVYAPCDDGAKQGLWDLLSARLQPLGRSRVCVCGDFNAVKHVDERRSSQG
ncbi:cytochrome P450, partial [Trifolium medium]|nr:cytochrome P450 [Trifolium medium]